MDRLPRDRADPAIDHLSRRDRARTDQPSPVRLVVRLTPGAGTDRVDGAIDGVLRVRVAARPVEGQANKALIDLLAADVGVARSRVSIVRGATGRVKTVELAGVEAALVRSLWPGVDV